jgi:hypothetical protein
MTEETKPQLRLTGLDGNAFNILGIARKAAVANGWTSQKIEAFMNEAMSGDYNHLLATVCDHFDVY